MIRRLGARFPSQSLSCLQTLVISRPPVQASGHLCYRVPFRTGVGTHDRRMD